MSKQLDVAFVSGDHPFDVKAMHEALRSLDGCNVYPQAIVDYVTDTGAGVLGYDAVVFYNMTMNVPAPDDDDVWNRAVHTGITKLAESSVGVVFLHHAILAFPSWRTWSDMVGIEKREFGFYPDQSVRYKVVSQDHPITRGVFDFECVDETYTMDEPGADSEILVTTEHSPSMRSIAWARTMGDRRTFCYQSGHDSATYNDRTFRTVLRNGIRWVAGEI